MGLEVESSGKMMYLSVPRRMLKSLLPHEACYKKIQTDIIGPLVLFILLLACIKVMGGKDVLIEPMVLLVSYFGIISLSTYLLLKAGTSDLSLLDVLSLLGYAQVGHICTLLSAMAFRSPGSNAAFYLSFTLFGGCSSIRLVVLFGINTQKPIFRLLAGCTSCIAYLLLILYTYFLYMYPIK